MVIFIRLLRPLAYLAGIAGALIIVNAHSIATKRIGWALVIAMVPFFFAATLLTSIRLARQKNFQRRRRG